MEESVPDRRLIGSSDATLFEKLFTCSPDAILVVSADGRILEANTRAEEIFGYSRNELLQRTVEDLVPHQYRSIHPHHREAYGAEPHVRPMGGEHNLFGLRKGGREFPVDIMLSPVKVDGHYVTLAVVRDISKRRHIEDQLRKSEEKFRLLIDGARDYAIFMLDPEGKVATWNLGAERILGYRADEVLGKHFSICLPKEDVERGKPEFELRTARATGRYEDEGWRIRKDGSRFWGNMILTAIRDKNGELAGFSKVTRDFTSRKSAEESLLLELSTTVLSRLDIQQTFAAIAASFQHLAPHDLATIALIDRASGKLHLHVLSAGNQGRQTEDITLPIQNTPDGLVYRSQQPLFLEHLDFRTFCPEGLRHYREAGVKSACWLPLNRRGNVIGTISLGSLRESAFPPDRAESLLQVASTVAVTLDNTSVLQQIAGLSDRLKEEKRYLEEELRTEYSFEEIVGQSGGLKRVLKQVETVAPTDATVLVLGETGTGKELIARAIHDLSSRRDHTFVKLNCSAIPLGLLESELFGHEKGAFTGAIVQRVGRLELAHQGTLFLDEVGDLPLELQPKLLRALQEKEIERLGGRRTIPVDIRLIAATNRDLTKMIKEGQFRSDLYYRLRVFPIQIPSLKERVSDIPLLVNYFVSKHARRMNKRIDTIPEQTMKALTRWSWPGNIRELENFIERAVILTRGQVLQAPLGELEMVQQEETTEISSDLRTAERDHIIRVLRETNGMIGGPEGAAERLGLKRTTLNSKLKKLGVAKRDFLGH